jgi:TfoX/Sxy family transcriptional regulator of competence genes
MAYDEELADRIRARLGATSGVTELNMFGGWGVTIHGNMAVGVMAEDLIVRVGPAAFVAALERPGARPFDFTGRPMTGWVFVDGQNVSNARSLHRWVDQGVAFAQSLPPKHAKARRPTKKTK